MGKNVLDEVSMYYYGIELSDSIVMPNHIHFIAVGAGPVPAQLSVNPTYGRSRGLRNDAKAVSQRTPPIL